MGLREPGEFTAGCLGASARGFRRGLAVMFFTMLLLFFIFVRACDAEAFETVKKTFEIYNTEEYTAK